MELRYVTIDDEKLIYNWANDPEVRRNAINTEFIDWNRHQVWFQNKLNSENSKMYIAEINNQAVGQIRFDIEQNKYIIDYSISKYERGKGYGFLIVKEGINCIKNLTSCFNSFEANVKPDNDASKRVFDKLGFKTKSSVISCENELIVFQLSL